jgi:hypothetical protein
VRLESVSLSELLGEVVLALIDEDVVDMVADTHTNDVRVGIHLSSRIAIGRLGCCIAHETFSEALSPTTVIVHLHEISSSVTVNIAWNHSVSDD